MKKRRNWTMDRVYVPVRTPAIGGVYLIHLDEKIGGERHTAQHYIGCSKNDLHLRLNEQLKGSSRAAAILRFARRNKIPYHVVRVWPVDREPSEENDIYAYRCLTAERYLKSLKRGGVICPVCNPYTVAVPRMDTPMAELSDESIRELIELPF